MRLCGVGSNRTQPTPPKYISGQACRSWVLKVQVSGPVLSARRKPTATREGMPRVRPITAIAAANCSQ